MHYIASRDITVASRCGRSVEFAKGVATYAPPAMHAELIEKGIVPAEDMPEEPAGKGPAEPTIPHEREEALFGAFEILVLDNKRENFTAVGVPHCAAVTKLLGWDSLSAHERDEAWAKFQVDRAPT